MSQESTKFLVDVKRFEKTVMFNHIGSKIFGIISKFKFMAPTFFMKINTILFHKTIINKLKFIEKYKDYWNSSEIETLKQDLDKIWYKFDTSKTYDDFYKIHLSLIPINNQITYALHSIFSKKSMEFYGKV